MLIPAGLASGEMDVDGARDDGLNDARISLNHSLSRLRASAAPIEESPSGACHRGTAPEERRG